MKFPVTIEFRKKEAKIYAPTKGFAYYRVAFEVAGRRRMLTFANYADARTAAEAKLRELRQGQQASGLTAKEAQDALTIREVLAAYRQETGLRLSVLDAVGSYIAAVKLLPAGDSLTEAIRQHRQTRSAVQRKPLAEAVAEFCAVQQAKTAIPTGKIRPGRNPVYVADISRHLTEFATANPAADLCDLTKQHLDVFMAARGKARASITSRNAGRICSTRNATCGSTI